MASLEGRRHEKTANCPRLVIAATGSGVGKTSLTLGLVRALARQGLRVQTFKVGPDFLDPTYLAMASGRTCYNLDGWMTSPEYVRQLFARATADADLALVEGVMGLFDGASPDGLEGSTAEIASLLDAPVLLVVDAHGAARSLAATVKGFAHFEPGVRVAGVIANQAGSPGHAAWLSRGLGRGRAAAAAGSDAARVVARAPKPTLGPGDRRRNRSGRGDARRLGRRVPEHLDMPRLLEIAATRSANRQFLAERFRRSNCRQAAPLNAGASAWGSPGTRRSISIIPTTWSRLPRRGPSGRSSRRWPTARLPEDLDGLYFGGGYPEVHAARLAANHSMLDDVRRFAASGRAVYAECGGLMYLGRAIRTLDGGRQNMAGVLPLETAMLPRLKTLGYAEVSLADDSLWGAAGDRCRGHEFHYSQIVADDALAEGWRPAYWLRRRRAMIPASEGFAKGRLLASYVHLHWASQPTIAERFLACCEGTL